MIRRAYAGWLGGLVGLCVVAGCTTPATQKVPEFQVDPDVTNQVKFQKPAGMMIGWKVIHRTETKVIEKDPKTGEPVERTIVKTDIEDGWQTPQVTVPGHANYQCGSITILKLAKVPGREGKAYYCSLEMSPRTRVSDYYAAHTAIPVIFTDEDFDQIDGNNFVTKVVYLPVGPNQELALGGDVEMLVATRLDPGEDPIAEAKTKGDVLLIVRMGNRVPD